MKGRPNEFANDAAKDKTKSYCNDSDQY